MRVLLFDIDGTLLVTHGGGSDAIKQVLRDDFEVKNPCTNVNFSGRTDKSLLEEILVRNNLPVTQQSFSRLRNRYVSLLPTILDSRGGRVLPGAIELLERLHRRSDLVCHVMTGNLHETAIIKLKFFGLLHYFDEIFGGEHDSDRDDLARRTAAAIRSRHGELASQNMIVIGDTPADIQCGHSVGAQVLAVCSGSHDRNELEASNPMSVHDDLTDLETLTQILIRSSP